MSIFEIKILTTMAEWKGRLGCMCYDCWKWCNMGSREEYNIFWEQYKKNLNKDLN